MKTKVTFLMGLSLLLNSSFAYSMNHMFGNDDLDYVPLLGNDETLRQEVRELGRRQQLQELQVQTQQRNLFPRLISDVISEQEETGDLRLVARAAARFSFQERPVIEDEINRLTRAEAANLLATNTLDQVYSHLRRLFEIRQADAITTNISSNER